MYIKKRYTKTLAAFILFQFIIILFIVYFPMLSQFNNFQDYYLKTQREIFLKIFEKQKKNLLFEVVKYGKWDELYHNIDQNNIDWINTELDTSIQSPLNIEGIIVFNKKHDILYYEAEKLPITKNFINSTIITDVLKNSAPITTLYKYNNRIYLVGVSPIIKSTSPFNPNGGLIFIQNFDQYFISQKITGFMDARDMIFSIQESVHRNLGDNEIIIPLVSDNNTVIGSVILTYHDLFSQNAKKFFARITIISLVILFLVFIIISAFLSRKFAQRIELLHAEVERAVKNNFKKDINVDGNDEIADLSQSFNKLAANMRDHVKQILRANDKLNNTYLEIIHGLIVAIELKDPYTRGHSQRVMIYSVLLAQKLKYPYIDIIQMAALLHDIGKIGVPEQILNKPGRLTKEEYEIVKAHPDYGYKILSNIEGFNWIKNIIRFHHERIDGSGYPNGMKDIIIPQESRIIAIADTFDAITSDRAYRKAMTGKEAIAELQRVKGKQLDSRLVDTFIELVRENNYFVDIINQEQELYKFEDLMKNKYVV